MTFKPSAEQAPAITTRGKDILVSASAGSGKTAVLVERVLQLLERDRLNIDQLLLVTFTKEAAKNMRDRLKKRLVSAKDAHLKEQVARLALANISTIHAFCEQLINRYYYVIDLDPQYRLVADAERELLFDQAWQATQTAWLAPNLPDQRTAFNDLVANFATGPVGTGLEAVVRQLDDAANAQPDPAGWLAGLATNYAVGADPELTAAPFFQQLVGPVIKRELRSLVAEWQALAERAPAIFTDRLTADLALLDRAFKVDGTLANWETLVMVTTKTNYQRNPTKPKEDAPADFAAVASARNDLKKQLGELHDRYFALSGGRLRELLPRVQGLVKTLTAVTKDLRRRYQIEKQRRHLLDYADLEHYADAILTGTNINPLVTWTAEQRAAKQRAAAQVRQELQQRYREIMVDEYQDTNRLQDDLLQKLHAPKRNHFFMVGDMKQSIYRFRQADPTLFAGYYRQLGAAAGGEAIDLSDNYRSQQLVTDFTNLIFTQLMDQDLGEMDYDQKAALTAKAQWGDDLAAPEVLVYQRDAAPASTNDLAKITAPEMATVGEVWMVGQRIRKMLAEETILDPVSRQRRPITPGDIVILARTKAANNAIVDQFAKLNLPVVVHGVENYLQATEIRVVMSLLRLVDNEAQDIPLVAVMRAPLIRVAPPALAAFGLDQASDRTGFSEPEMAVLRALVPTGEYYAAVRACYDRWYQQEVAAAGVRAATPGDERDRERFKRELARALTQDPAGLAQQTYPGTKVNLGLLFLKLHRLYTLLDQLGQIARQQPLVDLIWAIYQETGYLDYVGGMTGGPQCQANLHALYERASSYEETSFKGLYQFIHFVEQLQQRDADLGVAPAELATDAINVMTIHGAKGLQFPVVFLINTNHQFRTPNGTVVVAPRMGIGLTSQEATTTARVKEVLPQYEAIRDQLTRDNRAEEMRLLYVALTRAEQRLVITAEQSRSDQRSQYKRWLPALTAGPVLSVGCRLKARSMFDWLMQTLIRTAAFPPALLPADVDWAPKAGFNGAWVGTVANAQTVTSKLAAWTAPTESGMVTVPAGASRDFKALVNQVLNFTYPDPVATTTTAFQAVSTIREAFARQDPADLEMGRLVIDQHRVREGGAYLGPDKTSLGTPAFIQEQQADRRPAASVVGTATHLVFQTLDLTRGTVTGDQVAETVARLTAKGQIEGPKVAQAIDQAGIVAFYQTPLGRQLLQTPGAVHREAPFSMLIPAATLFRGLRDPASDVLVHGIIDGYQERGGRLALFDYKTDRVSQRNPDRDLARLVAKYQGQLVLYAAALAKMTGVSLAAIDRQLYFVRARRLVTLDAATMREYLEGAGND